MFVCVWWHLSVAAITETLDGEWWQLAVVMCAGSKAALMQTSAGNFVFVLWCKLSISCWYFILQLVWLYLVCRGMPADSLRTCRGSVKCTRHWSSWGLCTVSTLCTSLGLCQVSCLYDKSILTGTGNSKFTQLGQGVGTLHVFVPWQNIAYL